MSMLVFYVHPWVTCPWFCFGIHSPFDIYSCPPNPPAPHLKAPHASCPHPCQARDNSPETLSCIFFQWWYQRGAWLSEAGEFWVLTCNSSLLLLFCPRWRVCVLVLRCFPHLILITWHLSQMLPPFFLFSSSSKNVKEICNVHLPRGPNKYFNSCYVFQHLQAAFSYYCLLTCSCPPWSLSPSLIPVVCATDLLSHLTQSVLCWRHCSSAWCLAPSSIGLPLVSLVITFLTIFLF